MNELKTLDALIAAAATKKKKRLKEDELYLARLELERLSKQVKRNKSRDLMGD